MHTGSIPVLASTPLPARCTAGREAFNRHNRASGHSGYGDRNVTTAFRDSTRFALRDRTAPCHERIDARFGRLDLASREGLGTFLAASHAALQAIEPLLAGAPGLPALPSRLDALEADLAALGHRPPAPAAAPRGLDPLGVAYVVAGSALGGRLLARRRAASHDPAVRAAGRFMDDARMMPYWTAVQGSLRAVAPGGGRLEALTHAAVATFGVYADALRKVERGDDG